MLTEEGADIVSCLAVVESVHKKIFYKIDNLTSEEVLHTVLVVLKIIFDIDFEYFLSSEIARRFLRKIARVLESTLNSIELGGLSYPSYERLMGDVRRMNNLLDRINGPQIFIFGRVKN